jgi:hypothetical protein
MVDPIQGSGTKKGGGSQIKLVAGAGAGAGAAETPSKCFSASRWPLDSLPRTALVYLRLFLSWLRTLVSPLFVS